MSLCRFADRSFKIRILLSMNEDVFMALCLFVGRALLGPCYHDTIAKILLLAKSGC